MNLTFCTTNAGKRAELAALVEPLGYRVTAYAEGYPELQADTLDEVTAHGADALRDKVTPPFLLEDSGLFVHALAGFPGVYSRYALDTIGLAGLLRLAAPHADRRAHFATDLVLVHHGVHHFTGRLDGVLATEPRGTGGFGFDSVFVPDGHTRTLAQMHPDEKNALSHRGKAVQALLAHLRSQAAKA